MNYLNALSNRVEYYGSGIQSNGDPMTPAVSPKSLSTQAVVLPEHRSIYYGGTWHEPKSGRYVETINPATGQSLGKVADASAADGDAAVEFEMLTLSFYQKLNEQRIAILESFEETGRAYDV